jgi:hypothetical protein
MRKPFIVVWYIGSCVKHKGGASMEKEEESKPKIVLLKKKLPVAIFEPLEKDENFKDAIARVIRTHKIPPDDVVYAKQVDTQIVVIAWKYEFNAILCNLDKTIEEIKNGIKYSDWQFVSEIEVK